MFEKQGEGDKQGNTEEQGQGHPAWRSPNLRTWVVRRFLPSPAGLGELESVIVIAHGITHTQTDGIVFSRFYLDPVIGPQPIPVRAFARYYDYEDITPEPAVETIIH